jgi:hypothetical protein
MGTHGTQRFITSNGVVYLVAYRQFDGYDGIVLSGYKLVSSREELPKLKTRSIIQKYVDNNYFSNIITDYINFASSPVVCGIQDLAARSIANEKDSVGYIYVCHPDDYGSEGCNNSTTCEEVELEPEKDAISVQFTDYLTVGFLQGGKKLETEIINFTKEITIINGISSGQNIFYKYANGFDCFMAQFVKYFKEKYPENVYIISKDEKYKNHFIIAEDDDSYEIINIEKQHSAKLII